MKRICVVGAGYWGERHIKTLQGLGSLAGIVEPDETRLESLKALVGEDVQCFVNIREALEADFDGFTIATPAETHAELAKFVLEYSKPVLVEKPLALSSRKAKELEALAREKNVNLMVGHVLLFHPAIRKIKELLDEGKIGKLEYIYSNRLNLGTVRTEENILWSFAPHDISIFDELVGSTPMRVTSRGAAFLQPHIHDSTMTVLEYPGNIVGHIFVSWLHPFKEHRIVVIGSKGMLSFEDSSLEKELLFYEKGIDWVQGEPIKRDGATESIEYPRAMPLTEELSYFIDHLDGPAVKIADARNGVQVLEVLERATESMLFESEQRVSSSLDGDVFVHPSSYVDERVNIGAGTKIWHFSHVQSDTRIGQKCSIGQNVNVGNNVTIGDFVKIQNNVSVYEGVELEDYVFCGPSMVFTNVMDPRSKYPQRGSDHYLKTRVKTGASLGANSTILCGNTIGRHAFIGAGAVVTKDVPDYALVAGVPAKQIGWVCECGERLTLGNGRVTCPRCSRQYHEKSGILMETGDSQ